MEGSELEPWINSSAEEPTALDIILDMVDQELARLRLPIEDVHWWHVWKHAWWDGVHTARMVSAWKLEDIRRAIAVELQNQRRSNAQPRVDPG